MTSPFPVEDGEVRIPLTEAGLPGAELVSFFPDGDPLVVYCIDSERGCYLGRKELPDR